MSVSYFGLTITLKKYLKAKKTFYGNSDISTYKKYNLQKKKIL
jgi:hypothetical protein